MATTYRPAEQHRFTVEEAGFGPISVLSVVAGTVAAFGTFAIVAAIAGSLLAAADVETDFRTDDWMGSGFVAGLITALVLFVAYLFGGYIAGRMARRHGLLHGIAVVVLGLAAAAAVGGAAALADDTAVQDNLRSIGLPTTWDQVEGVALFGAIASLVAVVLGGVIGGPLGERWHARLARRVADPEVGPLADARAGLDRDRDRLDRMERERAERVEADRVLADERARAEQARHDGDADGWTGDDATRRDELVDLRAEDREPHHTHR